MIDDKLKKILTEFLELDDQEFNEMISADNVENWDSLKQMNIIVALEEEFEILFDEDEAIISNSYQDLKKLIESKIK